MPKFPRIIHQTWETRDVPKQWLDAQQSFVQFCSKYGFEYKLWTASDRRALVEDKYKWFLPAFDSFKMNVKRADAWRYFVLYEEGGWYFDLDFAPKPETLVALFDFYDSLNTSVAIAKSATAHDFGRYGEMLTNACMLSQKNAPFWKFVWEEMKVPLAQKDFMRGLLGKIPYFDVIFGTGPGIINAAMKRYLKSSEHESHSFLQIPCEFISCGYEWDQKPFTTAESAVTLFAGSSWHTKSMVVFRNASRLAHEKTTILIIIIAILFLFVILLVIMYTRAKRTRK